jgi:hypothetical protein
MYAPENLFSSLLLYHLPTSDDDTTGRSLRPIFAVSIFASENVVKSFTRARRTALPQLFSYQVRMKDS